MKSAKSDQITPPVDQETVTEKAKKTVTFKEPEKVLEGTTPEVSQVLEGTGSAGSSPPQAAAPQAAQTAKGPQRKGKVGTI